MTEEDAITEVNRELAELRCEFEIVRDQNARMRAAICRMINASTVCPEDIASEIEALEEALK